MTNNTTGLDGWIYFVRANDAIKIGFSMQPKSRVVTATAASIGLLGGSVLVFGLA